MELSKKDRWILSNQFQILKKLYPEGEKMYEKMQTIVEEGFTLNYDWITEHILDETTEYQCKEILDILDMYTAIFFSHRNLTDKAGIDTTYLKFIGFDGNHEAEHMVYTQFLINTEGKFAELKYGNQAPDFNSHQQMLDNYRRMLQAWENTNKSHTLSKDDINTILTA
jgi:uncharacterized protein YfbU (UPF0304 family)